MLLVLACSLCLALISLSAAIATHNIAYLLELGVMTVWLRYPGIGEVTSLMPRLSLLLEKEQ